MRGSKIIHAQLKNHMGIMRGKSLLVRTEISTELSELSLRDKIEEKYRNMGILIIEGDQIELEEVVFESNIGILD